MKKMGLVVVAVALSLGVAAFAAQQDQPKAERSGPKDKAARNDQKRSPQSLAGQIAQIKQEQKVAIDELAELKKLANEEKAPKTAAAIDKVIARRNQEFQKRLEPLLQAQKKLEAAQQKNGNTKEAPKKTAPKKK